MVNLLHGYFFTPAAKIPGTWTPRIFKNIHVPCNKTSHHAYVNSCTSIRYNNIHANGKHPICFGVFRPHSRTYSTEKNKIMASDIVGKIIVKMQILKWLKNWQSITQSLEFSRQDANCNWRIWGEFSNHSELLILFKFYKRPQNDAYRKTDTLKILLHIYDFNLNFNRCRYKVMLFSSRIKGNIRAVTRERLLCIAVCVTIAPCGWHYIGREVECFSLSFFWQLIYHLWCVSHLYIGWRNNGK
jgi:hypothetical protein